jgi:uncharacterized protein with NRDE domain
MCTLVVAANVDASSPLVVIANRDEQLGRASSPPMQWPGGFFAPRDELAGGTWLGWNPHGVFVGITNRYLGPRDATRRSRGELVVNALESTSVRAIHEAAGRIDPAQYNGFHLVYTDGREVLATVADGKNLMQLSLGQGLSIVTERSFGAADDSARVRRILDRWSEGARDRLLTDHDPADPLAATCIHLADYDYGTRSAMVLRVSPQKEATMLWAEGPPCTTPFTQVLPVG